MRLNFKSLLHAEGFGWLSLKSTSVTKSPCPTLTLPPLFTAAQRRGDDYYGWWGVLSQQAILFRRKRERDPRGLKHGDSTAIICFILEFQCGKKSPGPPLPLCMLLGWAGRAWGRPARRPAPPRHPARTATPPTPREADRETCNHQVNILQRRFTFSRIWDTKCIPHRNFLFLFQYITFLWPL